MPDESTNPNKPRPDKPPGSGGRVAAPSTKPVKEPKPAKVKVKTTK